jgi:hypothetical protein
MVHASENLATRRRDKGAPLKVLSWLTGLANRYMRRAGGANSYSRMVTSRVAFLFVYTKYLLYYTAQ